MVSDTETRFGPTLVNVPWKLRVGELRRARRRRRCDRLWRRLDAASRGLSVALVEKRRLRCGNLEPFEQADPRRLRYLESFDVELVREALHERRLLVGRSRSSGSSHALPVPSQAQGLERFYVARALSLRRSSRVCTRDAAPPAPDAPRVLTGGAGSAWRLADRWHPLLRRPGRRARFSIVLARTAASHGAVCVSAVGVVDFLHAGERVAACARRTSSRVVEFDVRASTVINATRMDNRDERLAGVAIHDRETVQGRSSRSAEDRIDSQYALILRTRRACSSCCPGETAGLSARPIQSGITVSITLRRPTPTSSTPRPPQRGTAATTGFDDVIAVFVGLRPLLGGTDEETAKLSRNHAVRRSAPGFVSVAGGK